MAQGKRNERIQAQCTNEKKTYTKLIIHQQVKVLKKSDLNSHVRCTPSEIDNGYVHSAERPAH